MTDQPSTPASSSNYIELAADIVSAYVSKNSVRAADLPGLIASVHGALQSVANPAQTQPTEKPVPAVPIRKSVTPDAIISLEDGKPYRSLKRHLTKHGMTPEQYREKWGLPRDYPMVAPSYAARRSELARSMGLGRKRKEATKAASTSDKVSAKAPAKAAKKSGRKKSGGSA